VGTNGGALSVHQSFAAGNVYMSYTDFLAGTKANSTPTHLMFTRSTDCGVTWSAPVQINSGTTTSQGSAIAVNALNGNVYVTWRQFASTGIPDAMMIAVSTNAGRTFGAPVRISTFTPFDQGTTNTSIRTNAYPSITSDYFGFVYVAFSAKGMVASGDARVVAAGSLDGTHWTPPIMVDNPSTNAQTNPSGRGHQIMPAISFANCRLTILYLRSTPGSLRKCLHFSAKNSHGLHLRADAGRRIARHAQQSIYSVYRRPGTDAAPPHTRSAGAATGYFSNHYTGPVGSGFSICFRMLRKSESAERRAI